MNPSTTTAGLSTSDVSVVSGASERQLDYWARHEVLVPSIRTTTGSGCHRIWSLHNAITAAILVDLSQLGSRLPTLRHAARHLATLDLNRPDEWPETLTIGLDGQVDHAPGWTVPARPTLAEVLHRIEQRHG